MTAKRQYNIAFRYTTPSWARIVRQYYVLVALFVFGTALSPFLADDDRNFLLIGFMALSPALALAPPNHLFLYLFMCSIILFPPLINPEHLRWSTVFFSLMFSLSFIAYENVLRRSHIDIEVFRKALRLLLLAFFVTLLAQQFCVLTGLPIINESHYSIANRWKLNSLSAEPSHAARMISILMFAYLSLEEIRTGQKYSFGHQFSTDRFIWLGFFWSILSMQSATAILFLPLIALKLSNRKSVGYVLAAVGLTILALPIILISTEQFDRALSFVGAASELDYRLLLATDHSGSLRIAPLFVLAEMVEVFSWQGVFGNGIDTVSTFMSHYIPGVPKGYTGGGMLMVWYEYGFITFILFVLFSMRAMSALRSVSNFIFWLLIVFVSGPNNQILWFCLIIFASIAFFKHRTSARARQFKKRG